MKVAAELRLKHGVLYEVCRDNGGIANVASIIGIGCQTVRAWLKMRRCPTPGQYNRWYTEDVEKSLEALAGVPATTIFPPELKAATSLFKATPVHVRILDIEPEALAMIATETQERLTFRQPEKVAGDHELSDRVKALLRGLSYREREVITLRYGLDDGYSYTLDEVADLLKVSRERVRQIEAKAVRKLQQPSRAQSLVGFIDDQCSPNWDAIDKQFKEAETATLKDLVVIRAMDDEDGLY